MYSDDDEHEIFQDWREFQHGISFYTLLYS